MRIVIEGTPEEVADAIRRLAGPQDIKPIQTAPYVPQIDPFVIPFIPYDPPQTVPYPYQPATDRLSPFFLKSKPCTGDPLRWGQTQTTSDGVQFTYTM